jgi:hypothetical protein
MQKLLTTATLILAGGLISTAIAPAAQAQFDNQSSYPSSYQSTQSNQTFVPVESIPRRFERAFFQNSGDFYYNRTIPRQVELVFGVGLPENQIQDDANLINGLYRELSEQQNNSDPILRSPDIRNPYDTSIRMLPSSYSVRSGTTSLERPTSR